MSTPAVTPKIVEVPGVGNVQFPGEMSDQQVSDAIKMHYLHNPQAAFKAAPSPMSLPWLKEKLYNAVDAMTQGLPAAGATAGALIGAGAGSIEPGAGTVAGGIGGAGIGGMAGEAGKQILRRWLGYEAPQTGNEAGNEITKQGVIQGGIEAATAGLGRLAPPLRSAAVRQYTQAIKPTTAENKIITQDVVPSLIQRGVRGSTEDIEEQAAGQIAQLRPQVNAAYSAVPQSATAAQSPITTTLKTLDDLKGKYLVDGKVVNPQAVNAIEGVQQVVQQHSNDISPQSLRRIKQIFDESVSEAGGFTNNDLTTNYSLKAQKVAGNQIRNILHTAGPEAAAADKEISFWLDVQQVSKASNIRRAGQEGGLAKTFTPLAAGAAGAVAGIGHGAEAGIGAGAVSALAGYVAQAMRTPAWRTSSAIVKDRLATALVRGDVRTTVGLLGRFGVALPAALTAGEQQNRSGPAQQ